jgi:protein-disulfide isomerase
LSQIREQYVSAGQVRFVYKNFAILGQESSYAAQASECAAEQDLFWEFHDFVFLDQATAHSSLSRESLISLATDIGLDEADFAECLNSGRYASEVSQAAMSIQSLGVRGTPGFVINGVYISGAQPFEVFQQVIDEQLALLGETPAAEVGSFGERETGPPPPSE